MSKKRKNIVLRNGGSSRLYVHLYVRQSIEEMKNNNPEGPCVIVEVFTKSADPRTKLLPKEHNDGENRCIQIHMPYEFYSVSQFMENYQVIHRVEGLEFKESEPRFRVIYDAMNSLRAYRDYLPNCQQNGFVKGIVDELEQYRAMPQMAKYRKGIQNIINALSEESFEEIPNINEVEDLIDSLYIKLEEDFYKIIPIEATAGKRYMMQELTRVVSENPEDFKYLWMKE